MYKTFLIILSGITLPLWVLTYYVPRTGLRVFSLSVFMIYAVGFPALLKRKLQIRSYLPYLIFACVHIMSEIINKNPLGYSFTLELLGAILFLIVVVENIRGVGTYSAAMNKMMIAAGILLIILLYQHLIVYRSVYFSPYLEFREWRINGVHGTKGTIALFLCFLFPFAYARFTYKKTAVYGFFLFVVSFSALYTLSRMALVSLVFSLLTSAVFSFDRKKHLKQFVVVGIVLFLAQAVFHVGIGTFFKLKAESMAYKPTGSALYSVKPFDPNRFVSLRHYLHSHRAEYITEALSGFLEKPVFGHGVYAFMTKYRHATHNDFTLILYELGLVGFASFLLIFFVSLKNLLAVRDSLPPEYFWLWEGQTACFLSMFLCLLFLNAYKSLPFWFMLAGNEIMFQSAHEKAISQAPSVTAPREEGKSV